MKFFVTGASGFVGRHLVHTLIQSGDSVVALSRSATSDEKLQQAAAAGPAEKRLLSAKGKSSPDGIVGTLTIVRGDLKSKAAILQGMRGCDAVIHLAAKVQSWGRWADFQEETIEGTRSMLEIAKAAGVPRFVHVSTIFANVKASDAIGNAREEDPMDPPDWAPYSKSKAEAEKVALAANDPARFEVVVIKPSFCWGRGDTLLKPGFTTIIQAGLFRWTTPLARVATTHVSNAVHALRLAATVKGVGGNSYFVTDGKAELWKDFITWYVCSQPGVATPTGTVPLWLLWGVEWFLENLPFLGYGVTLEPLVSRQILAYVARDVTVDTSKIQTELGYKPVVSMKEGLQELAAEYS